MQPLPDGPLQSMRSNTSNPPLSPSGRQQAGRLATLPEIPPAMNPSRREVQLKPYKADNATNLALDPETGLLYRLPAKTSAAAAELFDQWPDLVGKVTPTGRTLPSTTTSVHRVFDALRRIAGDERRIMQVGACGM